MMRAHIALIAGALALPASAQQIVSDNPLRIGEDQKEAVRVNEAICAITGAAPVPVPPPMPAVTNTMCAPVR